MKRELTWDDKRHILTMLLNEDEFFKGGIPSVEKYLRETYGLTDKKMGEITYRLYALTKAIR